jgi:O-antigen ligase
LGILWSIDPFSTFKMALRLFTIFISITAFFIHHPFYTSADKILKYISALFILTSIVIVVIIPGATDPDFNTWRGLSPSKNIFGQVSVLTLLIVLDIYLRQNTLINKTVFLMLAFISVILLFGSQSSTSIIGFLAFCSIISIRVVDKFYKPLNLGRFLSSALLIGFGFSVVLLLVVFPNILESFTALFGKDPSFTGRTDLWLIALNSFREHFPLGTAYGAFWNAANKDLTAIHIIFPWLPMQAHSGILDTLNEGGIIGFILFVSATIKVLIKSWKFREKNLWFYMIIIILVLNTQETTIFVPGYLATTIFILIYVRSIVISNNNKN